MAEGSASQEAATGGNEGAGVTGRYAAALFDLATEAGVLETIEADLKALKASIDDSDDLRGFLRSPVYDRDE